MIERNQEGQNVINAIQFGALMADVAWLKTSVQQVLDRVNQGATNCQALRTECRDQIDDRLVHLEEMNAIEKTQLKYLIAGAWAGASGFVIMLVLGIGYFLRRRIENGS
ncbi:MAG TPA: hypothetical protein PLE60_13465 [Candidatus Latescibacteria bacterium]|nr:hypothetical protein [Candidatus Latescibacterota bacterium]